MTEPDVPQGPGSQPESRTRARRRDHGSLTGGVILIVLGCLFLAEHIIPGFSFGDYWPLLLIAIGVLLLWRSRTERNDSGRMP